MEMQDRVEINRDRWVSFGPFWAQNDVSSLLGYIFQEMNWIIPINKKHGKFTVQSLQWRYILMKS